MSYGDHRREECSHWDDIDERLSSWPPATERCTACGGDLVSEDLMEKVFAELIKRRKKAFRIILDLWDHRDAERIHATARQDVLDDALNEIDALRGLIRRLADTFDPPQMASTFSNVLPDDLRLPVREALRCRSVRPRGGVARKWTLAGVEGAGPCL